MKKLNAIKQLLGMGIFHDKIRNTIYITQQQYIECLVELATTLLQEADAPSWLGRSPTNGHITI